MGVYANKGRSGHFGSSYLMKVLPHIIIYTDHDLAHNSFWDSVITREAVLGRVTLEFRKRKYTSSLSRLFTTFTEVRWQGSEKRVVIDFHDNYDFIAHDSLQKCDIYFKVNYRPTFVETMPPVLGKKVRPFVPHFTVAGERDISIFARLIGSWIERIHYHSLWKPGKLNMRRLLYQAGPARLKRYRSFVKFSDYDEFQGIQPIQDRIFFIASLYPDGSGDKEEVNMRRIDLVRKLRSAYGPHYYGGIVKSPFAQLRCPDLIFKEYLPHRRYLQECKRSDICIYSNGPNHCVSWKLGEYIWLGKPIVSEKLWVQFTPAFNVAHHLVESESLDEIVDNIETLRTDKDKKEALIRNNEHFFCDFDFSQFYQRIFEATDKTDLVGVNDQKANT